MKGKGIKAMDTVEKRENFETEIDLKELIYSLLDRMGIIILSGILFAVIAFVITVFFITPKYVSTSSIYIMNKQEESQITNSDLSVSTTLTKDVEILVTSRGVLEQVAAVSEIDRTVSELSGAITVNNPSSTRILEISVLDKDAYTAKLIADAVAAVAGEQLVELMGVDRVNIIEYGNIPSNSSTPNMTKNIAMGGLGGVALAIIIIIIIFVLDDTIRTAEDVEIYLGTTVLGVIPDDDTSKQNKKTKNKNGKTGRGRKNKRGLAY